MFDLKIFRAQLGVTQAAMAEAMGMPLRSYEDVEAGKSKTRPVHLAAAKWAAIELKASRKDLNAWPTEYRDFVASAIEQNTMDDNKPK